jgi:hypothetical protein
MFPPQDLIYFINSSTSKMGFFTKTTALPVYDYRPGHAHDKAVSSSTLKGVPKYSNTGKKYAITPTIESGNKHAGVLTHDKNGKKIVYYH